jgi:putative Mn2+ efflux pump MntP
MTQVTTRRSGSVTGARVCTILAFVFAAVAILFAPIIFGPAAIVLGLVGGYLGDRPLGWYAAAAGVLGGALGFVLGAIVLNAAS